MATRQNCHVLFYPHSSREASSLFPPSAWTPAPINLFNSYATIDPLSPDCLPPLPPPPSPHSTPTTASLGPPTMPPSKCQLCLTARAILKRPKTSQQVCKTCFFWVFEEEVHNTIVQAELFKPGDRVAIGASGGKGEYQLLSSHSPSDGERQKGQSKKRAEGKKPSSSPT